MEDDSESMFLQKNVDFDIPFGNTSPAQLNRKVGMGVLHSNDHSSGIGIKFDSSRQTAGRLLEEKADHQFNPGTAGNSYKGIGLSTDQVNLTQMRPPIGNVV